MVLWLNRSAGYSSDFVRAECIACGHDELIPASALLQGLRLPPTTLVRSTWRLGCGAASVTRAGRPWFQSSGASRQHEATGEPLTPSAARNAKGGPLRPPSPVCDRAPTAYRDGTLFFDEQHEAAANASSAVLTGLLA
jgi:hypothetical protein